MIGAGMIGAGMIVPPTTAICDHLQNCHYLDRLESRWLFESIHERQYALHVLFMVRLESMQARLALFEAKIVSNRLLASINQL